MELSEGSDWIQNTFRWWCQFALYEDLEDSHQGGYCCSTCISLTGAADFHFCKTNSRFISSWFVYTVLMHTFKCFSSKYEDGDFERSNSVDSLHLMSQNTCILHCSLSFISDILESTPITCEIKNSSKLSLSIALRLWLSLCISHYALIMTHWLISLTFYVTQTLHMYETDLPKPQRFFSSSELIIFKALTHILFFSPIRSFYVAGDQRCL